MLDWLLFSPLYVLSVMLAIHFVLLTKLLQVMAKKMGREHGSCSWSNVSTQLGSVS